jgi:[ribosomal protein S5]-alanine N-acetyltransferase
VFESKLITNLTFMIESERLIIRPYTIKDADSAFTMFNNPDVMAFIPDGCDKSVAETRTRIIRYIDHYKLHGYSKYVLIDKSTNELIGDCGICKIENTEMNELGYRIKKAFWNKGFATEGAKSVIEYAFSVLGFREIHAIVENENKKSIFILCNKLGFKYAGQIFCYGTDFDLYRLENK